MIKSEFYYDSRDGKTKLYAVRYTPDDLNSVIGVLQIVHGMAEYIERYEEVARFFTERGFVVTGADHIGHGKSVGKDSQFGYFCEHDPATVLVRDVHRLKKATQMEFPDVPYIMLGHSMGSFILRNYLMRYSTGISAAVIMGTGMQSKTRLIAAKIFAMINRKFFGAHHVSKLLDRGAMGHYNQGIVKPRTQFDWLTRDSNRVDKYLSDPRCGFIYTVNGFLTLFELILRLYDSESLERMWKKLPVLMVSGDADPVGEYGKTVRKSFVSLRAVGMENVELKLYEGARHELFNETNREEVRQYIQEWMEKNVLQKVEKKS